MTATTITIGDRVRFSNAHLRAVRYSRRSHAGRLVGPVLEIRTIDAADYAAVLPDDFDQPKWIAVADLERAPDRDR
jgi:hypothetical protein